MSNDRLVCLLRQPKDSPVREAGQVVHRGSTPIGTECVMHDAGGVQVARSAATYMVIQAGSDGSADHAGSGTDALPRVTGSPAAQTRTAPAAASASQGSQPNAGSHSTGPPIHHAGPSMPNA